LAVISASFILPAAATAGRDGAKRERKTADGMEISASDREAANIRSGLFRIIDLGWVVAQLPRHFISHFFASHPLHSTFTAVPSSGELPNFCL